MVSRGFEASKKYLELKFKNDLITREELQKRIKQLTDNYKSGKARREMAAAGMKDYREF